MTSDWEIFGLMFFVSAYYSKTNPTQAFQLLRVGVDARIIDEPKKFLQCLTEKYTYFKSNNTQRRGF